MYEIEVSKATNTIFGKKVKELEVRLEDAEQYSIELHEILQDKYEAIVNLL